MFKTICYALVFAASLSVLAGQDEAELKEFFEGRYVITKIDMPGDKSGVDLRLERTRQVDFAELGQRLKRYGIAIRRGERVMVTLVKVNKKNIEFQLGGGGYGTFADTSPMPSIDTSVAKSSREKALENDIKKETDPARKKRLKAELDDLRTERDREQARLEAEAAHAKVLAEAQERDLRSTSGSRFNLWFDNSVPPEAMTPGAVKAALAEYLEFRDDEQNEPGTGTKSPTAFVLKKGLTEQEINRQYREPVHRDTQRLGDLTIVRSSYELEDGTLEAVFVEGVLVRYSMVSR